MWSCQAGHVSWEVLQQGPKRAQRELERLLSPMEPNKEWAKGTQISHKETPKEAHKGPSHPRKRNDQSQSVQDIKQLWLHCCLHQWSPSRPTFWTRSATRVKLHQQGACQGQSKTCIQGPDFNSNKVWQANEKQVKPCLSLSTQRFGGTRARSSIRCDSAAHEWSQGDLSSRWWNESVLCRLDPHKKGKPSWTKLVSL